MHSFVIRKADTDDIPGIVDVMLSCFSEDMQTVFGKNSKEIKKILIDELEHRFSLENIIVATCGDKIAGAISLGIHEIRYDFFSLLKIFISKLGLITSIRAILFGGYLSRPVDKDKCLIEFFGVLPDFQYCGLGKQLVEHGEKFAKDRNKKFIYGIISFLNTPSINFKHLLIKVGYKQKRTGQNIFAKIFFKDKIWILVEKKLN